MITNGFCTLFSSGAIETVLKVAELDGFLYFTDNN